MSTFPRFAFICPTDWRDMAGDERSRFCSRCRKSVVNLSLLTEAERKDLISRAKPGELCVAYYREVSGGTAGVASRILPDPVFRRQAAATVAAGAILAAAAAIPPSTTDNERTDHQNRSMIVGEMPMEELTTPDEEVLPAGVIIDCVPPRPPSPAHIWMRPAPPPDRVQLQTPL